MTSTIGLRNPMWDLYQSRYEEIEQLPLMSTPGPVFIIIATYLLFILKIGPNFMRKREPMKLTKALIVYNAIQVAVSSYMVFMYFKFLLATGIAPKKCYINDDNFRKEILTGIWVYFVAKITELFDTIFFVLRKKDVQVTFLHLYHHSIMVLGTWCLLKYWPSNNLFFIGFINSLVHVFMYTYYGLAALGPEYAKNLTWKRHMTKLQLIQFVLIIVQYIVSAKVSECPPNKGVATFVACNTAFFLLLFVNFYRLHYRKEKKQGELENSDCAQNEEFNKEIEEKNR